jgi:hypothetical protein
MGALAGPTTLRRVTLDAALRYVVPPYGGALEDHGVWYTSGSSEGPCRVVTFLLPLDLQGTVYVGIDADPRAVGLNDAPFKLAPLPAGVLVPMRLQPHQTVIAAVSAGVVTLGILEEQETR